jgi:hypothetical protein
MDRISFIIYIPNDKKKWLTPNVIVLSVTTITILILWVADKQFPLNTSVRLYILLPALALFFYYQIISFWTYAALNGRLSGKLIVEEKQLIINDKTYLLSTIDNLDFYFGNYYGERSQNGRDLNPKLSQGVNNYITFTDNSGESHLIYLKLETKHSYLSFALFINAAVKTNKLTFNHAIDLIGIENVSL